MSVPNKINVAIANLNKMLYECYIYLKQTVSETITGDGTWQSPGTNIVLADPPPSNCSYIGGSIVYDGDINITRDLYASVTVKAISSNTSITLSGGVNGSNNTDYEPNVTLVNANDEKLLTVKIPQMVAGDSSDTVDFFIKADKDFTLVKANFSFGNKLTNGV